MTITPEQARELLKDWAASARRVAEDFRKDGCMAHAAICAKEAAAIDWALSRIDELEARETKAADLTEDLISLSEAAMLRANFDGGEYQIDAELKDAREFVKQLTGGRGDE